MKVSIKHSKSVLSFGLLVSQFVILSSHAAFADQSENQIQQMAESSTSQNRDNGGPSNNQDGPQKLSCPLELDYRGYSSETPVFDKFGVQIGTKRDIDEVLSDLGYKNVYDSNKRAGYVIDVSSEAERGPLFSEVNSEATLKSEVLDPQLTALYKDPRYTQHPFAVARDTSHFFQPSGTWVYENGLEFLRRNGGFEMKGARAAVEKLPKCKEIIDEINKERLSNKAAVSTANEKPQQSQEVSPAENNSSGQASAEQAN